MAFTATSLSFAIVDSGRSLVVFPWLVAATVRSLSHVSKYDKDGKVEGTVEQTLDCSHYSRVDRMLHRLQQASQALDTNTNTITRSHGYFPVLCLLCKGMKCLKGSLEDSRTIRWHPRCGEPA